MIKSPTKGFTLIEIVVAVAIVGVLAAVATVFYKDYVTRSRVSEALVFADAGRTRLEVDWAADQRSGQQKDLLNAAGKPVDMMTGLTWVRGTPADAYVGYIMAEMNLPGFGKRKVLALELRSTGDWHCVGAARFAKPEESLDEKYLPAQCRDGVAVAKVGAPASQPVAPTGQAAAPAVACPAGQDKVQTTDAKGIAISLCLPACPAGQTRNAQDPSRCDAPAGRPTSQADCQPNEAFSISMGRCFKRCNVGWYFIAGSSQCSSTPPAAAQPPAVAPTPAAQPPQAPSGQAGCAALNADGSLPAAKVSALPCPAGYKPNPTGCSLVKVCATPVVPTGGKPDANTCPPGTSYRLTDGVLFGPGQDVKPIDVSKGECLYAGNGNPVLQTNVEYADRQCHVCAGPPVLCEVLHQSTTCKWPNNICGTQVMNHLDGTRSVLRGCANAEWANTQWLQDSADNTKCDTVGVGNQHLNFVCRFACIGPNCNNTLRPAQSTEYKLR